MLKKYLYLVLILFSLLFNVQASFSHDIEHHYHDEDSHSLHDCEDCVLKHHVLKSALPSNLTKFSFDSAHEFFENYQLKNFFAEHFVAYQSRAP